MHEDERGALVAGFRAARQKELAVNFEAIGSAEDYLLWRYQLVGGKISERRGRE